jgi:hypothetical protein
MLSRYFGRLKTESMPANFAQLEFLIGRCSNNIKYSNLTNNSKLLKEFLPQTRNEILEIASTFNKSYFGNT